MHGDVGTGSPIPLVTVVGRLQNNMHLRAHQRHADGLRDMLLYIYISISLLGLFHGLICSVKVFASRIYF